MKKQILARLASALCTIILLATMLPMPIHVHGQNGDPEVPAVQIHAVPESIAEHLSSLNPIPLMFLPQFTLVADSSFEVRYLKITPSARTSMNINDDITSWGGYFNGPVNIAEYDDNISYVHGIGLNDTVASIVPYLVSLDTLPAGSWEGGVTFVGTWSSTPSDSLWSVSMYVGPVVSPSGDLTTTGIEESLENMFAIFPNPSIDGVFKIRDDRKIQTSYTVRILDQAGREVAFEGRPNEIVFPDNISNGIYAVQILSSGHHPLVVGEAIVTKKIKLLR